MPERPCSASLNTDVPCKPPTQGPIALGNLWKSTDLQKNLRKVLTNFLNQHLHIKETSLLRPCILVPCGTNKDESSGTKCFCSMAIWNWGAHCRGRGEGGTLQGDTAGGGGGGAYCRERERERGGGTLQGEGTRSPSLTYHMRGAMQYTFTISKKITCPTVSTMDLMEGGMAHATQVGKEN